MEIRWDLSTPKAERGNHEGGVARGGVALSSQKTFKMDSVLKIE